MALKRLNVGCGSDIRNGWVNLDVAKLDGVDVVHDIEKLPLPFPDYSFDEILCKDVLEHVDYVKVLRDLHRILKAGGRLTIRVPHFSSRNNFADPTHKKMFSIQTFNFFVKNGPYRSWDKRSYYFDFSFNKISGSKIIFSKYLFYDYPLEFLFNICPYLQNLYEMTFLSRFFPADSILITIEK